MFVDELKPTWLIVSPLDDGVGPFNETQLPLCGIIDVEYAMSVLASPHATHVPFPYAIDRPQLPNKTEFKIGIQLPAIGGFSIE